MLLADIHGHPVAAAQDDENYLTSAVFGHLRYIPPKDFWGRLLSLAHGLAERQPRNSLDDFIRQTGHGVSEYESLKVHFWPKHRRRGEPDLLLSFEGPGLRPMTLVIEVKLWAGKGGGGEDQLVRYLQILDELEEFPGLDLPDDSLGALLYLTPHESLTEVLESLKLSRNPSKDRARIFRLQWQDFIRACDETLQTGEAQIDLILGDVREFLRRRGLEYFTGFRKIAPFPELQVRRSPFNKLFVRLGPTPELRMQRGHFNKLFVRLEPSHCFAIRRAPWVKETQDTENRLAPR